jgi:hypothetical protein
LFELHILERQELKLLGHNRTSSSVGRTCIPQQQSHKSWSMSPRADQQLLKEFTLVIQEQHLLQTQQSITNQAPSTVSAETRISSSNPTSTSANRRKSFDCDGNRDSLLWTLNPSRSPDTRNTRCQSLSTGSSSSKSYVVSKHAWFKNHSSLKVGPRIVGAGRVTNQRRGSDSGLASRRRHYASKCRLSDSASVHQHDSHSSSSYGLQHHGSAANLQSKSVASNLLSNSITMCRYVALEDEETKL